jgi:hypothetical protein
MTKIVKSGKFYHLSPLQDKGLLAVFPLSIVNLVIDILPPTSIGLKIEAGIVVAEAIFITIMWIKRNFVKPPIL